MRAIDTLLTYTIERTASDLHLVPGSYPTLRVNGILTPLTTMPLLTGPLLKELLFSILTNAQQELVEANREIDLGISFNGYRFRVNIFYTTGMLAGAFRLIPNIIPTIEELGLPPTFHDFCQYHQGLVLITGPTGEGKSTSLASIINEINTTSAKRIITVEDPIEYIYPKKQALISQREVHLDTLSWSRSLESALREDPDVLLVGEMRDYETIQSVLTLAETGHLVFSTLHTGTTPEAINRIVDVFPAHQQGQIRNQLSSVLRAIVSQRLIPAVGMNTRLPAFEILMNSSAVASLIRDGKAFMIDNVIQTSEQDEMVLFEKDLARLYKEGKIARDVAVSFALRPKQIEKFL